MNEQQEQALLADVKSLTDHMNMVDEVFAKARIGLNMILVFECGESGLFYPSDYVRNWGAPWGDGLGPDPVSESLQSMYEIAPPEVTREVRTIEQIMHPLRSSRAQMDAHLVEASVAMENMAIPMHEDYNMVARAPILRAKQLANPRGALSHFKGLSLAEIMFKSKKGGFR